MLRFVVIIGILEIDPIVEQCFLKAAIEIDRGQRHGRRRFDLLDSLVSLSSKPHPKWRSWRRPGAEEHRHDAQDGERSGQK